MRFAAVMLLFVVGCAADPAREITLARNEKTHVTPQIELAYRDGIDVQLDGKVVDRIPLQLGAPAVMPIEGRHCIAKVTQIHPPDKLSLGFVRAVVQCDDGPTPGAQSEMRGARSLVALWALPAFVLGLLLGILNRGPASGKLVLALLAIPVAVIVPALAVASGGYIAGLMVLAAGLAFAGYLQTNAPEGNLHPAQMIVLFAPLVAFAVIWPRWSPGAPVLAFAIGAVCWIVTMAIRVLVTPTTRPSAPP